jgi:hypothetical protein
MSRGYLPLIEQVTIYYHYDYDKLFYHGWADYTPHGPFFTFLRIENHHYLYRDVMKHSGTRKRRTEERSVTMDRTLFADSLSRN